MPTGTGKVSLSFFEVKDVEKIYPIFLCSFMKNFKSCVILGSELTIIFSEVLILLFFNSLMKNFEPGN